MAIGRIHSFQSLGAVDGPGLRYVIFMQGCPYSCPYCHNPDTKSFLGGEEYTAEKIVKKVLRYRTYFGENGGVTLSGGEPLMQAEFAAELFEKLHEEGINTALDTAAVMPGDSVKAVLKHTDTVLCDIKYPFKDECAEYFSVSLDNTLAFLSECDKAGINIILRYVVVPDFNDSEKCIRELKKISEKFKNFEKIEFLPFHKMCIEKYKTLGIPFPLESTPECTKERIEKCKAFLK